MRGHTSRLAVLALTCTTVVACSLVLGGDLDGVSGGAEQDAGAGGGGEGGLVDAADQGHADAGDEGVRPAQCGASLTFCDDGTGCAAGTICTPLLAAGGGWVVTTLALNEKPACSAGYKDPLDEVVFPNGSLAPATCVCACAGPPSCDLAFSPSSSNGCNNIVTYIQGSSCANAGFSSLASMRAQVRATCQPMPTNTIPSLDGGTARTCTLADTSSLCEGHRLCAPMPPNGSRLCIMKRDDASGAQAACPAGFTSFHVGTAATDTRQCPPCTCQPQGGCASATAAAYTGTGCSGTPLTHPGDNTCVNYANPAAVSSFGFSPSSGGTCNPVDAGGPTGQATVANGATVCCAP